MNSLPAGWETRYLDEVVELRRGFDLPTRERRGGTYPVLSAGVTAGWHDEGPPIKGPGMVVGRATNLGVPTWSDGDFWPLNTTLYVSDFKENCPRFVFHLFENMDLSGFDSGSVQPMLNRNYIAKLKVSIPPVAEQQAISEVLAPSTTRSPRTESWLKLRMSLQSKHCANVTLLRLSIWSSIGGHRRCRWSAAWTG